MISGISAQLPERWKLKIGQKGALRKKRDGTGEYRIPEKWDHIKICTLERDQNEAFVVDEELTKKLGGSAEPKEIGPIIFLYNDPDLNLWTAYRAYQGRTCMCRGDGETAKRVKNTETGETEDVTCPCERLDKGKCKPNGILSFVIPDADLGGVCKFRTTSWNSIRSLLGGMAYFRQITGGTIRGVPFYLQMNEKDAEVKGKPQKIYFLSIGFKGNLGDIRKNALEYATDQAKHMVLVENVEAGARKRLAHEAEILNVEDEDAVEFHPTVEEREDGVVVDRESGAVVDVPEPEKKKPKFPMKGAPADESEPVESGPEDAEEGQVPEEADEETPEAEVPGEEDLLI